MDCLYLTFIAYHANALARFGSRSPFDDLLEPLLFVSRALCALGGFLLAHVGDLADGLLPAVRALFFAQLLHLLVELAVLVLVPAQLEGFDALVLHQQSVLDLYEGLKQKYGNEISKLV